MYRWSIAALMMVVSVAAFGHEQGAMSLVSHLAHHVLSPANLLIVAATLLACRLLFARR